MCDGIMQQLLTKDIKLIPLKLSVGRHFFTTLSNFSSALLSLKRRKNE